jgi:hypothetical protein
MDRGLRFEYWINIGYDRVLDGRNMQGIQRHRISVDGVKTIVNNAHLDGGAIQRPVVVGSLDIYSGVQSLDYVLEVP